MLPTLLQKRCFLHCLSFTWSSLVFLTPAQFSTQIWHILLQEIYKRLPTRLAPAGRPKLSGICRGTVPTCSLGRSLGTEHMGQTQIIQADQINCLQALLSTPGQYVTCHGPPATSQPFALPHYGCMAPLASYFTQSTQAR